MLEGLEVNELLYSNVIKENRIDSEFYQKRYVLAENIFIQKKLNRLFTEYKVTDGEHGSVKLLTSGIKYLTAENIKKGYVDINNVRYVDQDVDNRNARARVNSGDILISIKGTLGEIAIAEDWLLPANMNRDVAIFKPIDKNSSYVTAIFLMSKFGEVQSSRGGSGGVQQMLTLERLRQFYIPKFNESLSRFIDTLYINSQNCRIESKSSYETAEKLLIEEIDLDAFNKKIASVNIKKLSNSFIKTGRLDAEYYQPKYDEYLNLLKNYHNGFKKLTDVCELKNDNHLPNDETQYKYIELSNIGNNGEVTGCTVNFGKELPSRARRIVKEGDVLISSIEGSLSSCALVTKEYDGAICSTGFYVVNSKKINSETLLILFKSELMQNLLKQGCSGTILTAINNDEFKNLLLPVIDDNTQKKIASLIQQSSKLKKQSEQLLEVAKKAVEIAIEQNETAAINYINSYSELMQEDGKLH